MHFTFVHSLRAEFSAGSLYLYFLILLFPLHLEQTWQKADIKQMLVECRMDGWMDEQMDRWTDTGGLKGGNEIFAGGGFRIQVLGWV